MPTGRRGSTWTCTWTTRRRLHERAVELGAEVVGHPDPGTSSCSPRRVGSRSASCASPRRSAPCPRSGRADSWSIFDQVCLDIPADQLRNRVRLLVRPHGLGAASVSGGGGVRLPGPAARDTDPDPVAAAGRSRRPSPGASRPGLLRPSRPRPIGTSGSVRSWSGCTNGGRCCAAPPDRRTASPTETRRPGCSTESRWLRLSKPTSVGVVTTQRTDPPLAADEATTLLAFLDFHRDTLRMKTDGLDQSGSAGPGAHDDSRRDAQAPCAGRVELVLRGWSAGR